MDNRMVFTPKLSNTLKTAGPSLAIILLSSALLISGIAEEHPAVYTGIIVDLCLLSPLLVLGIGRFLKTSPMLTLPFLGVGFFLCYFLIPWEHRNMLTVLQTSVLPVIELGLLSWVVYKATTYARKAKKNGVTRKDGLTAIREVLQNSGLPQGLARFLTTEIGVFYYALWAWKPVKKDSMEFSMYRESGQIAVCLGLLLVLGIETVVLHSLLSPNYTVFAWILSILSIYSCFYFLAHLKALWLRPTILTPEGVWFKNGLLGESFVAYESIEKVERRASIPADLMDSTGGLGLKNPPDTLNMLIYFSTPQMIKKPYGQKKAYRILGIYIDRPHEFESSIHQELERFIRARDESKVFPGIPEN